MAFTTITPLQSGEALKVELLKKVGALDRVHVYGSGRRLDHQNLWCYDFDFGFRPFFILEVNWSRETYTG